MVTADSLGGCADAGEIGKRVCRSPRQTEDCGGVVFLMGGGVSKPHSARADRNPSKLVASGGQ